VVFAHFANLTGGSGNDSFAFADGASISGAINGGGGTNALDYSAFSAAHPVVVNLGTGTDTLAGGAGDDTLTGTGGNNLLIGGTGTDTMTGSGGGDILIAGYTSWDANYTALRGILAEWTSADPLADRVGDISGPPAGGSYRNGAFYLNAGTVFSDGSQDKLSASGGSDWYFVDLNGADVTPKDKVTGNTGSSIITAI
jgi:Ca2+-binding RTX toxin-like protein